MGFPAEEEIGTSAHPGRAHPELPQACNVSEAARLSGISCDTIYMHRRLVKEGGVQALKRQVRADHIDKNRTDQEVASTVIAFSNVH